MLALLNVLTVQLVTSPYLASKVVHRAKLGHGAQMAQNHVPTASLVHTLNRSAQLQSLHV